MKSKLFLIALTTSILFSLNASAADKIFLGILEPYTDSSWEKEVESDWIRVPFFWNGKEWLKMPEYHAEGVSQADTLLIYPDKPAFFAGRADKDGKEVYTQIITNSARFNSDGGINAPVYAVKAIDPSLVNYLAEDDNYCQLNNICKRPLILTTASSRVKEDAEGWEEEAELKPEEKKLIYSALKKQFAAYNYCSDDAANQSTKERKWKDDDVNEIKIYRTRNDELLVGLQLNKDLNTCDGPPEEPFTPHWFYLKNGEANFIGKNVMPIEYADYSGNGKTEWIFGIYGFDNAGYLLFSDDFKNKLVYDWVYH